MVKKVASKLISVYANVLQHFLNFLIFCKINKSKRIAVDTPFYLFRGQYDNQFGPLDAKQFTITPSSGVIAPGEKQIITVECYTKRPGTIVQVCATE